jgi:hypothetical protein
MPSSGWTLETLKTVVEAEIVALDKVTTSRFVAGDTRASEAGEAIKVGLANAQRALDAAAVLAKEAVGEAKAAHAAEHAAQAMALTISTLELKERLTEMNNFRAQLTTERGEFATRDRLASAVGTLEGAMAVMATQHGAALGVLDARLSGTITDVTRNTSRLDQKDQADRVSSEKLATLAKQIADLTASVNNMQSRFLGAMAAFTIMMIVFEFFWKYVVH